MAMVPVRSAFASSARAYTRRQKMSYFGVRSSILDWSYWAIQPPPPRICGSPNGPPITASRIKLKDGRHLAYEERGVPREEARYMIVSIHGFDSCRHDALTVSEELAEELGVCILSFDRPGYGESDPNPKRTAKGIALDVEELADQLELGSKFYVVGVSMGGQAVWGCLKYIPHRLAGATLIAPVVNYFWPGFPVNLSKEAYNQQPVRDQWALRVVHHLPWLTYWWNTQKWFPAHSAVGSTYEIPSFADKELVLRYLAKEQHKALVRQQGEFESIHRDLMVGFGKWDFTPMDIANPFPSNEGSVYLWQGDRDVRVPPSLQRYIAKKLPWIHYREIPGAGHSFARLDGMADAIVRTLLLGDKQ